MSADPALNEALDNGPRPSAVNRAAFVIVAAVSLALPLIVDKLGQDSFRLPKEVVFRGGAIALLLVFALAVSGRTPWRPRREDFRRAEIVIPVLAVVWTLITTLTSTYRITSAEALATVIFSAAIFIGVRFAVKDELLIALDIVLVPALINAVITILQHYQIWNPFTFPPEAGNLATSALIGHPNEVGTYLLVPAVIAAVGTAAVVGLRRIAYAIAAVVLLVGIVASGTRGALLAYIAALALFTMLRGRRNAIGVVILVAALVGVMLMPSTAIGQRVRAMAAAAKARQYDVLFSQRLPAFLAAGDMWRDHPLMGVGPGAFRTNYMRYRLQLFDRYPKQWASGWPQMFGETHNDHLQILAETGIPGYLLFLGALAALAWPALPRIGRPPRASDARSRMAHELRLPLAAALAVVALTQFPLQVPASRLMFLYFGALCCAWDAANAS